MADLRHANGVPRNMVGSFARIMCKGQPLYLETNPHQLDLERPQFIATQIIKEKFGLNASSDGKKSR